MCKKKTKSLKTSIPPPLECGQYFCDSCIGNKTFAQKLIGRQVHVFWPTDNTWYRGFVSCYDEESMTHRVLYYEDINWEFVDLTSNFIQFEFPDRTEEDEMFSEIVV